MQNLMFIAYIKPNHLSFKFKQNKLQTNKMVFMISVLHITGLRNVHNFFILCYILAYGFATLLLILSVSKLMNRQHTFDNNYLWNANYLLLISFLLNH